ncbi:MAG: tRNA (adenosine(37)-N6)-dimethylallyltransferase MiaA [Candidatus Eremiobacteraeota bacterium]|nr:tRNA (adenosine(37)-N6)-dimethylallyltransferase MiaA [Candidatus Eremiobacteraeota bacterium]
MHDTVLILAGATASGKTELAIEIAVRANAEIINADSRQIYRGMPVGTAAPSQAQRAAVPHHLFGFLDPAQRYSAARYASDATAIVKDIHARGRRAIVVGGSGFYIRALTGSVELAPQYDEGLRKRLACEAAIHEPSFLHAWLALRDPVRARAVDVNDTYRVTRALEIALASSHTSPRDGDLATLRSEAIPFYATFLDVPLDELDARIARRATEMIESGLLEEAERIGDRAVAANAVGYPQALAYRVGWCTREELHASLARATRRYARRQRSWFRHETGIEHAGREQFQAIAREKLDWL